MTDRSSTLSGAELFTGSIINLGIDTIFTLVGDHLNEVLAVAARAGLRIIDMRHESGATHAADAYARLTRKPALSLVTGGPGHTNSLTGIATAQLACSPLLAVSGARASTLAHRQAFQDIDQIGMTQPVVKWAAEPPTAAQIPFYLARAWSEANTGRKGAVHLTIPVDLFLATAEAPASWPKIAHTTPPAPDPDDIDHALRLLRAAERPVVIAGSGVWWADASHSLRNFIDRSSLPLYTITMGRGVVSDDHPWCFGFADPALNRAAHRAFQEADLFLVIGKRLDYRLALGSPRVFPAASKFIQVDIHPQELGLNRALDLAICADAGATLRALTAGLDGQPYASETWLNRQRQLRAEWREWIAAAAQDTATPLHPAAFFRELQQALPAGALYCWDGGDFVHWGRVSAPARTAGGWLRLGPLGAIGSALPNALAMRLVHPDKPVVLFTGDGALGFYIAELDSLVRHKLPVVIIVGNDAGWGLERELQGQDGGPTVACELQSTRYDVVMRGFGGEGETIDRLDQVRPAVERAFASGRPYLINANIRGVRSPFTDWQVSGRRRP